MARELALAGHLLMDIAVRYQPLGYETACGCGCGQKDAPYETVQIDFWESEADTPAFVGATRSGKTMTGAAKLYRNILKHNTNGLVVGPTWDQTRQIQIDYLLKLIPKELTVPTAEGGYFHETQKVMRLVDLPHFRKTGEKITGPTIYARSGEDARGIYGFTCGTVWLDEAPQLSEEVFGASVSRCSQKPSQLFATFTPKGGTKNWANRKWALGALQEVENRVGRRFANPDPHSPAWIMDYRANYTLGDEWRRIQEANLGLDTPYGRQELLGEVVDYAGLVFEMFDPKLHVRQLPEEFVRVSGGIDRAALGGTTTVGAMGLTASGRVYSFFEWGQKQATLQDLVEVLAPLTQRCRGIQFHMDPHPQGEYEIETLRRLGLPVRRAAKKEMMDSGIRLMWQYMRPQADGLPGYFISPECVNTIGEYQSWCFVEGRGPGGTISYEDVERRGKDYIDKERYAMVGLFDRHSAPQRPIRYMVGGKVLAGV